MGYSCGSHSKNTTLAASATNQRYLCNNAARNYPGRGIVGRGIVELYAWPTLRRVRLLPGKENIWQVRVDSGFSLRQPWDREYFVLLVRDLIGADDLLESE